MEIVYIVCFILLGIGALGDLVAFMFLLLGSLNGIGSYEGKSSKFITFKLSIDKSVLDTDLNSGNLNGGESGEDNIPIDDRKTID